MNPELIRFDCKFFRGDVPCTPNKLRNKICDTCDEYIPISKRILIIKLGAIGDVIRTTPLIHRFRKEFPDCHISWLTLTPEIVPASAVDKIYKFDFKSVYSLTHQKFDIAINLDKDIEACALLNDVSARQKFGFIIQDGHLWITNTAAGQKLVTGMFDSISRSNTKNYLQEIFEICGFDFRREKYILDLPETRQGMYSNIIELAESKKIIGLNTGCGKRWLTRLWPEEYWIDFINRLQENNFFPLLLGGPDEDDQNKMYAKKTGAHYPGTFPLQQFLVLSNQCDVIVSAVTMTMHIAIALEIPLVLFNNIFNPNEFELYDNGIILQPSTGCDCYFRNSCKRERHCMRDISVDSAYEAVKQLSNP